MSLGAVVHGAMVPGAMAVPVQSVTGPPVEVAVAPDAMAKTAPTAVELRVEATVSARVSATAAVTETRVPSMPPPPSPQTTDALAAAHASRPR